MLRVKKTSLCTGMEQEGFKTASYYNRTTEDSKFRADKGYTHSGEGASRIIGFTKSIPSC